MSNVFDLTIWSLIFGEREREKETKEQKAKIKYYRQQSSRINVKNLRAIKFLPPSVRKLISHIKQNRRFNEKRLEMNLKVEIFFFFPELTFLGCRMACC
jgi:hypothetical protein